MQETEFSDRFMKKVHKSADGCWLWQGGTDSSGAGIFSVNGRSRLAHRVSHELHVGIIPPKMVVKHRCTTISCVNPEHLFLAVKDRDMRSKPAPGTKILKTKVTDQVILEVKRLKREGRMSAGEIGMKFGINERTVYKILNGDISDSRMRERLKRGGLLSGHSL